MMGKYTPGPWTVDESHINGAINAGKRHVALANFYNCHDEEVRVTREQQEANAQLIASAPDLLDAAQTALECLEGGGFGKAYAEDVLRAAIRKAEGEGE